jgi:hypothetical protein
MPCWAAGASTCVQCSVMHRVSGPGNIKTRPARTDRPTDRPAGQALYVHYCQYVQIDVCKVICPLLRSSRWEAAVRLCC